MLEQVRSFNRTVAERIGALQDSYLNTGRPLGADRVLWEIGDGSDLKTLRNRLNLDSGYLSRLIASLGDLVETAPGEDKRVKRITLTAAGRAERAKLDERSDALARRLLDPLGDKQRTQLTQAMATVERLLTAGLVEFAVVDQQSPDARACLSHYYEELNDRFDAGFDPAKALPVNDAVFVVARLRGEPIACGAIKLADSYIKRMWVSPAARGLGVGRRLLRELERHSRTPVVRLETNRSLTEAINLYRSEGYVEVEPFNDEPYADFWFEKRILAPGEDLQGV